MIQRTSLKEQVYNYLRKSIINKEIEPGKVYSQKDIAKKLKVSRTPVREAILQLRNEEFLQIHPNSGFTVKKVSIDDAHKIMHLRIAIEGYCCMYLAKNKDTSKGRALIKNLENYLKELEEIENESATTIEFMKSDLKFHTSIVEFSGNMQMVSIMQTLRARIDTIGSYSLSLGDRMLKTIEDHRKILASIKEGNEFEAFTNLNNHVEGVLKYL